MKTLLKFAAAVVALGFIVIALTLLTTRASSFPEGSESAHRLQSGPWTVSKLSETFVDNSRPTQANGEFEGAPQRRMDGDFWYPKEVEAGAVPLLVFSHGFTSLRSNGQYLAEHLASHGFAVVAVDYPLTSMRAPGGPMLEDVVNQPADVSFLIDTILAYNSDSEHPVYERIDANNIGVFGVSLGGLTSTLVGFHPDWQDPRIGAVLSIAGPSNFFTPDFFENASPAFMMFGGELDVLVPFASNAAPIPAKVPGATLIEVVGGSHTGFSGGTRWLRWMRNTDALGCYSVMRSIDEGAFDKWTSLLGPASYGIDYEVEDELCQVDPLPKAINPVRQQMISEVVVSAFFEATLLTDKERRDAAQDYLSQSLSKELGDVRFSRSSER